MYNVTYRLLYRYECSLANALFSLIHMYAVRVACTCVCTPRISFFSSFLSIFTRVYNLSANH